MQEILRWTGGQPFLTQRLCQLVVDLDEVIAAGGEAVAIDGLVNARLIDSWETQDHQEHLKTIRQRLLDDERKAGYLLELYRQIRQEGEISASNQPEERELQLSGLVVKRDSRLRVYNPIYRAVFDEAWIDDELRKLRPYAESFRAWVGSGKVDSSRLLRGGALAEAEAWASEKTTLSAEDREFLAASRAQQREEEISEREQEAELARERTAREAAETAEQIQAEATREAQQKIRRGGLVLAGALVSALVLGGFALGAGNRFRAANQQLIESRNEKNQIDQDLRQAQKQVTTTRKERDQANKELVRSQENLTAVETQRQEADEELKQAQQAAKGQQALLTQLKQNLANADTDVAQAQKAEQKAQREAAQAADDLAVAQQALEKVNQEQQEIAALNETTKALSGLIDDLYAIDKPEAAEDVIQQIGLSFTDFTGNSSELKQVLLNSSMALAHLQLIPFPSDDASETVQEQLNKAKTPIEKSIDLIDRNPNFFNSSDAGRAIAFFTYAVEGNLWEEQESSSARSSYEEAFSYISET